MHATSLAPAPISEETRDESEENKKVLKRTEHPCLCELQELVEEQFRFHKYV